MVTIVNPGKLAIAKLINGVDSVPYFADIAIGSGSTAEADTQTALVTEITTNGGARAAATRSYVANNTAHWEHTFTFSATTTVREMGVFNSANTMLLRHVYAANKVYAADEGVLIEVDTVVSS